MQIPKEILDLMKNPNDYAKMICGAGDMATLHLWLRGPGIPDCFLMSNDTIDSPYEGGWFKVKLVVGPEFPTIPPKGYFLTKIFHPNVSASGEVCVDALSKAWKDKFSVNDIIMILRCLLLDPNPESALNECASKMLLENYEHYTQHARMITKLHALKNISNVEAGLHRTKNDTQSQSATAQRGEENTKSDKKREVINKMLPVSVSSSKKRKLMRI